MDTKEIQDSYCDPDTLGDFGLYMSEKDLIEKEEKEVEEDIINLKKERGDI